MLFRSILLLSGDGDFLPLLKFYEDYECYTEIIGPSRKELVNNQSRPTSKKLMQIINENGEIENRKSITYLDEIALGLPQLLSNGIRF